MANTPPSEAEANMAVLAQHTKGLQLFNHLSSTRFEIAGAIIATAADGPIHLGTDSQSFLTKAQLINNLITKQQTPRRPWPLHHDGDLWHLYHRHVIVKGPGSIKITKVKGHATQAMVDEGLVRPAHKAGSDMAYEAAEEGVQLFGPRGG